MIMKEIKTKTDQGEVLYHGLGKLAFSIMFMVPPQNLLHETKL